MKRNRMRRFFQQKQYAIASLVLFAAIAAMTGVYVSNRITNERQEQELAQKERELADAGTEKNGPSVSGGTDPFVNQTTVPEEEDYKSVTSIIKPEKTAQNPDGDGADTDTQNSDQKNPSDSKNAAQQNQDPQNSDQNHADQKNADAKNSDQNKAAQHNPDQKSADQKKNQQDTAAHSKSAVSLNFSPESDLSWPLQGDVILNYSMDQTVYFATLEQYKYNPALIIAGKVNDPVNAAATGKITDISANEETGLTVTMDLGNGYSAVYGQLKEVLYKEGATVEAGNAIGYIAEPTKYYSVEGSNLYFELLKDKEPVNPMQFMQ